MIRWFIVQTCLGKFSRWSSCPLPPTTHTTNMYTQPSSSSWDLWKAAALSIRAGTTGRAESSVRRKRKSQWWYNKLLLHTTNTCLTYMLTHVATRLATINRTTPTLQVNRNSDVKDDIQPQSQNISRKPTAWNKCTTLRINTWGDKLNNKKETLKTFSKLRYNSHK